jgi:hypothetical protein
VKKKPQQKSQIREYKNVYSTLHHAYNEYKSKYPLPSPMWKLQQDELKGVRTRFMKLLSFLLIQFKTMYENILSKHDISYKKQNENNVVIKNKNKNKKIYTPDNLEKIHNMYSNLVKTIEMESNQNKKADLNILKQEVEAKFGDILNE